MNIFNYTDFTITTGGGLTLMSAEASDLTSMTGIPMTLDIEGKRGTESFTYSQTERDAEGDIVAWHYKPVNANLPVNVTIFND